MTSAQEVALGEYLTSAGHQWWHRIDNFWLVVTNDSVKHSDLLAIFRLSSPGNNCMVVSADEHGYWYGSGPDDINNEYYIWMRKNWHTP